MVDTVSADGSLSADAGDTFVTDLEICYEVLLYLSSRVRALPAGATLEFISGDPQAEEKIRTWTEQRDYSLLACDKLPDGRWRFVIQSP